MASPFFVTIIAIYYCCRKSYKLNNYKYSKYTPTNLYNWGYYWIIINTLFINGGVSKLLKFGSNYRKIMNEFYKTYF